ncbi:predicted protein [Naegleria gruberi]|uniref:Predicted protein n=1 Tax=Naegleria gruberi TaxID=5762 RepID=D2W4B5_NAEGR|nr:uncharacterized protein NAEGRDRAFT_82303 [Naegleria gruberi]EFC36088.1 predicted protein [Naegleria gruberi]|eukprot:XP_002668832.1 predicted protein [Naegleria gruberi strain NEG-M]
MKSLVVLLCYMVLLHVVFYLLHLIEASTKPSYYITKVGGSKQCDGALAVNALLGGPSHLTFNQDGDLFVAEYVFHRIRKIDRYGYISTIAGQMTKGSDGDGGLATASQMNSPRGVFFDDVTGSLFVADTNNHKIRKIDNFGVISTDFDCFGIKKSNSSVCSSLGTCSSPNNCTCQSGYYGVVCQDFYCYGNLFNSSSVCSGHGSCQSSNNCTCKSGYYGANCDSHFCYGNLFNTSKVCSGKGVCNSPNNCTCRSGYYGSNCELFECFGNLYNSTHVCSNRGSCLSPQNCSCQSGYYGEECQFYECNGLLKNDSFVCSGRGICQSSQNCSCQLGYYGNVCENYECFGQLYNSSKGCTGSGSCLAPNNCSCENGYYGISCELYNCFGIIKNSSNVCYGHGNCSAFNNCTCSMNFYGYECAEFDCLGINRNNGSVCSGVGSCLSPNNCSCSIGHYGNNCEFYDCFNLRFDNSTVCSGYGSCLSPDNCNCKNAYYGRNCEAFDCYGKMFNMSNVCSLNGICSSPNNCTCNENYYGYDCSLYQCYDNLFNSSHVCSSKGQCLSFNNCSCQLGYYGINCELFECFGNLFNSSSVCYGKGVCNSPNNCTCDTGYYGSNCELFKCYEKIFNDSNICSSNGYCNSPNNCICMNGYYGQECELFECFGNLYNSTQVCSKHGECSTPQNCSCQSGYYGQECQFYECSGLLKNDSLVCSGRGICQSSQNCSCQLGYYGNVCENYECFGQLYNSSTVCTGSGSCLAPNNCSCENGYHGDSCELFECFDIEFNSSNVCSQNGSCVSPNNCSCQLGHYGNNCSLFNCFSFVYNSSKVCSSHGLCISPNECSCQFGYFGFECELFECYGNLFNSSQVCSLFGECISPNHCNCRNGYYGLDCELFECFGDLFNSSNVCSKHGNCSKPNECKCKDGYSGNSCNLYECFGVPFDNHTVCSKHGECVSPNNCSCEEGYNENNCELFQCYGNLFNSSQVCSTHGSCLNPNNCSCVDDYFGESCDLYSCFDILFNNSSVCSGNGKCQIPNNCTCYDGYYGDECSQFNCFGIESIDLNVCNGNGSCISPNICSCQYSYYGNECENQTFDSIICFGKLSTDNQVCSGRGNCSSHNNCSCEILSTTVIYNGSNCEFEICTLNYYGTNCSTYCNDNVTCSSHGKCSDDDGKCLCHSNSIQGYWNGTNCNMCQDTYYGEDCLTSISSIIRFSDNGNSLILYLKAPSNYGNDSVDCNKLVQVSEQGIFPTICHWKNKTSGLFELQIYSFYNNNYTLKINTRVFENSPPEYLFISIQPPDNPATPIAKLSTVTHNFGALDDIVIDASSSTSSLINFNEIIYIWHVINSPEPIIINNSSSIISFKYDEIPSGNYSLQLEVCNYFAKCSHPIVYNFTKQEFVAPQVKVADDTQSMIVNSLNCPIYIKKYTDLSDLSETITSQIKYEWKQIEGPSVDFNVKSNGDLVINSFSDIMANKYIFQVILSIFGKVSSEKITLHTLEPEYTIIMYQSNIFDNKHVLMNVEITPIESTILLNKFDWNFTCIQDNHQCDQSLLDILTRVVQFKETLFEIPQSLKQVDITLQIGNNKVSERIFENIPKISLLNVSPQRILLTTFDILSLDFLVSLNDKFDGIDSEIERKWQLNGDDLPSNYLTGVVKDISKSNSMNLLISKLIEGSSNILTFKVTHISSMVFDSFSYNFNVALNPKPCNCSISPLTGYALDTVFSISCSSCITSDTILQISFLDFITGLKIPLNEGKSSQIDIQLPFTGSESLSLFFTTRNIYSNSYTELELKQTILLPNVTNWTEIQLKKSSWDTFYKSIPVGDPRKLVFGYVLLTVDGMARRYLPTLSQLTTCFNGGIYNSQFKTCNCLPGFKKLDCSWNETYWNDISNSKSKTLNIMFDEYEERNLNEPQNEKRLSTQISTMYYLLINYDELCNEMLNRIFIIFKNQLKDGVKLTHLILSENLVNTMSNVFSLIVKARLSIDLSINNKFYDETMNCLSDLLILRERSQFVKSSVIFENDLTLVISLKMYPSDLSESKFEYHGFKYLEYPSLSYFNNFDFRKVVYSRLIMKPIYYNTLNETLIVNDNSTIIQTTIRSANHSLYSEIVNQNISISNNLISYYFQFEKIVNSSTIEEEFNSTSMKKISTTSQVICQSEFSQCDTELSDRNIYKCKCSSKAQSVTIQEVIIQKVEFLTIPESSNNLPSQIMKRKQSNAELGFLGFLGIIPLILIIILIVIIIQNKRMHTESFIQEEEQVELQWSV